MNLPSKLPIVLPDRVKPGEPIKAVWANQIREALSRLDKRKVASIPKVYGKSEFEPWKPNFSKDGANSVFTCNLGLINGMIADNWDDEFTAPADGAAAKFLTVEITSASGEITGFSLVLADNAPTEEVISPDVPPTTHTIVLSAILYNRYLPVLTTNLTATATEAFRESKTGIAVGEEPFTRHYRWTYTAV
jgi:hypothetical protein